MFKYKNVHFSKAMQPASIKISKIDVIGIATQHGGQAPSKYLNNFYTAIAKFYGTQIQPLRQTDS